MKKLPILLRTVSKCMIAAMTLPVLMVGAAPLTTAHAEAAAEAEYEAKKAAYREKLKAEEVTTDDLLIGSWVSFYSFDVDSYEHQLDQMAAAGLNFNLFPRDFGSGKMFDAAYWADVEEQYARRNMVYCMNGGLSASELAQGVEFAAGKQHCVGYHVIDEPGGSALGQVGEVMRAYHEADPERYGFTNLLPSYAGSAWLGGTYREYVENYVAAVGAENLEYLSHDFYVFQAGGGVNSGIFADMEVMRAVAYENGKLKTHAFPQSTAWNGMRMPNINEMRWNVYAYLAYGFKALSWFNLVCPGNSDTEGEGFHDSLIYRDGTIRNPELFEAWSELNWEVRGLSSALMNLDTVHAYHTRDNVSGVELLPVDFFIQPTNSKADFVISFMEAKDGSEPYIMIFNKSTRRAATGNFELDLSCGLTGIEYLDPHTGEYIPMDISDGVLTDSYDIGEGKLYRLKGDIKLNEAAPEAPSVDLVGGVYQEPQTVTVTPPTEGATVVYTLDGSYPTAEATPYTTPITLGKAGETSVHTLRVATVRGNAISEVVTRHYVINGLAADGSNGSSLVDAPSDKISSTGEWHLSDGKLSLTGGAVAETLNPYLDTSASYENLRITADFRFDETCDKSASAGILLRAAEGEDYLYIKVSRTGKLTAWRNDQKVKLTETYAQSVKVSDGFDLTVTLAGKRLYIEANGQLAAEAILAEPMTAVHVGVNATEGGAFTAEHIYTMPEVAPAPELEVALVKLETSGGSVTVPKDTSREDVIALLDKTASGTDENGESATYDILWSLDELELSAPGLYTVKGYPVLSEDSLVVNPRGVAARATLRITYDPDRTELNAAISLMESLRAEDYSPDTWEAAEEAYRNALGLVEVDVPQNSVTVAAVFLMDRLNALDPVGIDFAALDAAVASLKARDLSSSAYTEESRAEAAQVLAEAEGFSRTGPVTQAAVDELTARVTAAEQGLAEADTSVVTETIESETAESEPVESATAEETTAESEPFESESVVEATNTETDSIAAEQELTAAAENTEAEPDENDVRGCGSALGGAALILATGAAGACALHKKKED